MATSEHGASPAPPRPLSILFVCEGNVCRSPAAELLLGAALPPTVVHPRSAGVAARVGDPVATETRLQLEAVRIDPAGFAARQLEDWMITGADLVVAMTGAQRAAVVRRVPSALRRTWTLLDLAGTLEAGEARLGDGPDVLMAARTGGRGDVPDPWGRGAAAHRRTFEVVQDAVGRLVASVA